MEYKNKEQVGELHKVKGLGKLKVSCQLLKFLMKTRGLVYAMLIEDAIKECIGNDKVIYAKWLISRRRGETSPQ